MIIPAENPTRLILPQVTGPQLDAVRESLTYTDQKAHWAYQNMKKKGGWYAYKFGQEAYEAKLEELKKDVKKSVLIEKDGVLSTYSGLAEYLSDKLRTPIQNNVVYPNPRSLAWAEQFPYERYPFQVIAKEKLLAARHAGVQIGTGLGKSIIIADIIRSLGLKTLVMTPATNISEQLYSGEWGLQRLFGRSKVGAYFDGKKDLKKLITVANAQSLCKIEPGSPAWLLLQEVDVFIADESHQCPAETLAKVCFGAAARAPYRFFFSATQMRNDGKDLLLDAITGPIVFEMTVREGVDKKYLAKPIFTMFSASATDDYRSDDANEMTRKHLYYNPLIAKKVGQMVNTAVKAGMPALILIEEVEQFTKLLPYLTHVAGFAHGPLQKCSCQDMVPGTFKGKHDGNECKVAKEYWDSDPTDLVKQFNAGKLPILVGTSCISTGTDVKAVKFLVYWQGGKSEIQVKQAIGRGTRLTPTKNFCHVVDFDIDSVKTLTRHAAARREIYDDLYGPVREQVL